MRLEQNPGVCRGDAFELVQEWARAAHDSASGAYEWGQHRRLHIRPACARRSEARAGSCPERVRAGAWETGTGGGGGLAGSGSLADLPPSFSASRYEVARH